MAGARQENPESSQISAEHFDALFNGTAPAFKGIKNLEPGVQSPGLAVPSTESSRREGLADLMLQLEAMGFGDVEAARLIRVSESAASSPEAREARRTLNGLEAVKWAIQHGRMGEEL